MGKKKSVYTMSPQINLLCAVNELSRSLTISDKFWNENINNNSNHIVFFGDSILKEMNVKRE